MTDTSKQKGGDTPSSVLISSPTRLHVIHFIESVPTALVDQCVDMLMKYRTLPYFFKVESDLLMKEEKKDSNESAEVVWSENLRLN